VTRAGKCPGVVDLGGWVASWGRQTSGECARLRVLARRTSSQTLKWGQSLRKVTSPDKGGCLRAENREVARTTRRERSTDTTLGRRDVFGRQANHKRGARAHSDVRTAISGNPKAL